MYIGSRFFRYAAASLLSVFAAAGHALTVDSVSLISTRNSVTTSPALTTDINLSAPDSSRAKFIARKEPVENLFKAVGSEIHKAVRLSNKARQYRVSGEFELGRPFEIIQRVTSSLGLIWYFDGQVVYVYDNSEAASAMLTLSSEGVDSLIAFLKKSALYDHRYPIKQTVGTGLIYVSGPPKYVEIVQGAASLTHTQVEAVQSQERHVELVKIRHASVGSRSFSRRDVRDTVAGLADVLAAALGGGALVRPAVGETAQAVATNVPASRGAAPTALEGGERGMPSMDAALPAMASMLAAPLQAGQPARAVNAAPGVTSNVAGPMNIIAYASSNSLLLEGTARQIATAKRLIEQLDVPKDQVEMSLWVIDITKENLSELGAKWGASAKFGNVQLGLDLGGLTQGAQLSRAQTVSFIANISALSRQNKARIVSRPILLAQDNSPAVFDNSKTFFVSVSGERVASLEKITYGTMIDVTPHVVNKDGRIEMELNIEDGSQSDAPEGSGLNLPIVGSTKISTVARVQHEQSILVGGYTQSNNQDGTQKVPLLGDIPWIGSLFTYRASKDLQTIRLFLIQPRLLEEDSKFERDRVRTPAEINDAVDALRQQLEPSRA